MNLCSCSSWIVQGYSTVQFSRCFLLSFFVSCDNFYILPCRKPFVNNFFNFFWKFCKNFLRWKRNNIFSFLRILTKYTTSSGVVYNIITCFICQYLFSIFFINIKIRVTLHTHGVHSNESGLFKVALRQEAGFCPYYCIGLWPCSTVHGPGVNSYFGQIGRASCRERV